VSWIEASYPYRVVIGVTFFLVLGLIDWKQHPENPKRAKEYLFLLYGAATAVVYGVVHDMITVSISPAYFILGKGLDDHAHGLRVGAALLATQAAYGVGALAAAALLIANNPSPGREQLPYRRLVRLVLLPLACAGACALLGAAIGWFFPWAELLEDARANLTEPAARRFVQVQAIHTGTYAGAALGTVAAVIRVRLARARAPAPSQTPPGSEPRP
jgi:hypothetical protein